jgi:ATP-dependent RNA helicase RhlE
VSFNHLQLIEPILHALNDTGYKTPTPVQEKAIPSVLEKRDLLGCAQTGTGKTAAFTIPLLQLLHEQPKPNYHQGIPTQALILTPTRELAIQIGESIETYGKYLRLKHLVVFGGVSQYPQVQALHRGVEIIVATPGRLMDLMQQGYISLNQVKYFVLDEADRMLDMGFVHDVKRIIAKLPVKKQTLFFSATLPPEIKKLAATLLVNPVKVEVTPVSSTVDIIQQSVFMVEKQNKEALLVHLLKDDSIKSLLIFTQMKHAADKLSKQLVRAGINAEAIHGNKSQNARQRTLENFKNRRTRVLVATDIAARGIDINELTHVLNYELPEVPETYVHRIGRTGRAGAGGTAFSFCSQGERQLLHSIQKLIGKIIPVEKEQAYEPLNLPPRQITVREQPSANRQQPNRQQQNRHQPSRPGNGQNRFRRPVSSYAG